MDIAIVVTSNRQQEADWQKRLEASQRQTSTVAIAVCEDWPGGAGNGFGTLYAYQQACLKAQQRFDLSIDRLLAHGASVALYHTAGMGQRLFPLTAAEHNNKTAVQLPDGLGTTTVLEAVIRQTGAYAAGFTGRFSVFWGDQLFIPSLLPPDKPSAHVEILARLIPFPTEAQWNAQHLNRYGLIADADTDRAQLIDKVSYETLKAFPADARLGVSLGSFSLSAAMLQALLAEFHEDLAQRKDKCDSDQHFWMPLTVSRDLYAKLKGTPSTLAVLHRHYDRLERFKQRFLKTEGDALSLFRAVDVGAQGYWWDYGTVDAYFNNVRKLTEQSAEGAAMRAFFHFADRVQGNKCPAVDMDDTSIVCGSIIQKGKIRNSVVIGAVAQSVELENCIVINSVAPAIHAQQSLLYQVVDSQKLAPPPETIRADTFVGESPYHYPMATTLGRDGKDDWEQRLAENPVSYAQLWQINQNTDLTQAQKTATEVQQKTKKNLTQEPIHDNHHIKEKAHRNSR
jgi:hypothetical protein